MIQTDCPQCGKPFSLGDEFAGATIPCPFCQRPLTLPGGTPVSAPVVAKDPKVIIAEKNAPLPEGYVRRLADGALVVFGPYYLESLTELHGDKNLRGQMTVASESADDLLLPDTVMDWSFLIFEHPIRGEEGLPKTRQDLEVWSNELLAGIDFASGSEPAPQLSMTINEENWRVLFTAQWLPPQTGSWPGVRSGQIKRGAIALQNAHARKAPPRPAGAAFSAIERTMTHGDGSGVVSVAISPDGRRALSAGKDKTVRLWDLESGAELRALGEHWKPLRSAMLLGAGRRAVAMDEGYLCVHDCETGQLILEEYGRMQQMSATADGRFLFVATENGPSIYDLEKKFCVDHFGARGAREGNTVAIACSLDGSLALTAGYREAKLWKIDTFKIQNSLKGMHWRGETTKEVHCFTDPSMLSIAQLAFLPGTQKALAGKYRGNPYALDLSACQVDGIFVLRDMPIVPWSAFSVSANGRRIAIAHEHEGRPAVSVVELANGQRIRLFEAVDATSLALSATGSRIVIATSEGHFRSLSV